MIVVLILSIMLWGWVGYRVVAFQTGRLGPVTVSFSQLDGVNKFIQWSPRVESYQFNSSHSLLLPSRSEALFLVNPPKRFSQGTVTIDSTSAINLIAEYPDPAKRPTDQTPSRTWRWRDINRFPGGHRLHIINLGERPAVVKAVIITFYP